VISTHGAGLTNLLWCQTGTKVIEISQTELLEKKVYPVLSHHLGLSHHVLLGEKIPIKNSKNKITGVKRLKDFNNIHIDTSELLKILSKI
jgi:hypothetical protein